MPDEALLRQCRMDVFRGTGHGGQKRNRTDSAVRLTHLATGAVAACDETRSQHQNRHLALRKLRADRPHLPLSPTGRAAGQRAPRGAFRRLPGLDGCRPRCS